MKTLQITGVIARMSGFFLLASFTTSFVLILLSGKQITDYNTLQYIPHIQELLSVSHAIGMTTCFVILPLIYLYSLNKPLLAEIKVNQTNVLFVTAFSILLILCMSPALSWINDLNKALILPESMASIEKFMRSNEDNASVLTGLIAYYESPLQFVMVLFVVAIVPAIGEELMFRGIVQNEIKAIFSNPHVAIWTTAFLFSFIHLQFYGFFPRMLLGALLGYSYWWSSNLLVPMIIHFSNNALTLVMMNLHKKKQLTIDIETSNDLPWYVIIASAVITVAFLYFFKKWLEKINIASKAESF